MSASPRLIDLTLDDLRTLVREELRAANAQIAAAIRPPGPMTGTELQQELGISASTRRRLDDDGMPHSFVGTKRLYDLAAVRAWLEARGNKATKATPKTTATARDEGDDIDVTAVTNRAGLRRAGGAR